MTGMQPLEHLNTGRLIRVFYCYAHQDKALRDELANHLSALKRLGQITEWHDRQIRPGTEWKNEIGQRLDAADLILLLVSSDFIASEYSWSIEMKQALKRHQEGSARVIPIILRPVDWQVPPLGELQVLPTGGKPVTEWANKDQAFRDIATALRDVVADIHAKSHSQEESLIKLFKEMDRPHNTVPTSHKENASFDFFARKEKASFASSTERRHRRKGMQRGVGVALAVCGAGGIFAYLIFHTAFFVLLVGLLVLVVGCISAGRSLKQ